MKSERGIRFNLFFAAGFDNGFDVCGEIAREVDDDVARTGGEL